MQDPRAQHAKRIARLTARASRIFAGKSGYVDEWLQTPNHALKGNAPNELLATVPSIDAVEELLASIEHGMFA